MKENFQENLLALAGLLVIALIGLGFLLVLTALHNCAVDERSLANTAAARSAGYTLPVITQGRAYNNKSRKYSPQASELKDGKYKILVIDTGYDGLMTPYPAKLCKDGHFDFATETPSIAATDPHGTIVTTAISEVLQGVDYCVIVIQIVDKNGRITGENLGRAFAHAARLKVSAVNLSITGNQSLLLEERGLRALTETGAKVFVAAGNDKKNLDYACSAYPACYDVPGLYVVGAMTAELDQPAHYSNYGTKVDLWYNGTYNDGVIYAKGTSFASPRALADYILSVALPLPK